MAGRRVVEVRRYLSSEVQKVGRSSEGRNLMYLEVLLGGIDGVEGGRQLIAPQASSFEVSQFVIDVDKSLVI